MMVSVETQRAVGTAETCCAFSGGTAMNYCGTKLAQSAKGIKAKISL